MSDSMQQTIQRLDPVEMVRLGGAGNKVNRIALREVDCYVQPRAGLKFWDLCAPEVILRAMGGNLILTPQDKAAADWSAAMKRQAYCLEKNGGTPRCDAFSAARTLGVQQSILRRFARI